MAMLTLSLSESLAPIQGLGRPNTSRARFQGRPPRSPLARQRDTFDARFPFSARLSSSSGVLMRATAGASAPTRSAEGREVVDDPETVEGACEVVGDVEIDGRG